MSLPIRSRVLRHPLLSRGASALRRRREARARRLAPFQVTADFPGGNVDGVAILAPNHLRITARPDLSPHPLWFYFCLENAAVPSVRVDLANADECAPDASDWRHVRPVFSGDGRHWQRVARTNYVMDDEAGNYFTFTTPVVGLRTYVAYCFPYPPPSLTADLDRFAERGCAEFRRETLTETAEGRPLELVSVGPEARPAGAVWLVARQHAGETPPSFVLRGLLDWVTGPEAEAVEARRSLRFQIAPLVDVDGAHHGRFGKDEAPVDRNRDWRPEPVRPETAALAEAITRSWRQSPYDVLIDLHASHHGDTKAFFFGIDRGRSDLLHDRQTRLLSELEALSPEEVGFTSRDIVARAAPEGSLRAWSSRRHGSLALCLEMSYHLAQSGRHLNIKEYEAFGAALGRALARTLSGGGGD